MFDQLLKVFEKAAGVDHKRPITIDTSRGEQIYSDARHEYDLLIPEFVRGISCIESFVSVVIEECRRRDNQSGDFMTVVFNRKGGVFYPDDKRRLDKWTYERTLSQQWQFLTSHLNNPMKHRDFLRFLQGLRPSISGYPTIIREYRKVAFDGKTTVKSQPIIENGKAGSEIAFTLDVKNAETQTTMPGEILIQLPYARVSPNGKEYDLTLELDVMLDQYDQPKFLVVAPEVDTVIDQALTDEYDYFTERLAFDAPNTTDLLTLLDY